jgi:hypothetical protein
MIEFTCPCGQPLQAEDSESGLRTHCPVCGATPIVPSQVRVGDAKNEPYNRDKSRATSGKAIAALVLGVLSLALNVLTGLPALVFGARALKEIDRSRGRLRGKALAVIGMVLSALSLLVIGPALIYLGYLGYLRVEGAAKRTQSQNNLTHLAIAMHYYHDANGTLPPAQSPRDQFNPAMPKVSWRVLLLPYLGRDYRGLYEKYNFNEPWDSPNNKRLLDEMPDVYKLPGDNTPKPRHTYYQVFVSSPSASPHALFSTDPKELIALSGIKDGTSNTLMIVEAATAVEWTKPDDIAFDPNGPAPALGQHFNGGCNAATADMKVHWLPGTIDPATLKALITRDGGEDVAVPDP